MKSIFTTHLSHILKGEVFDIELPTISGECKGIKYQISNWIVENIEFSRFNLNLEKGELKFILEGVKLYTKMHFKAWTKKIEKLKSSIDPTCEIKDFDYSIGLKMTENVVTVTECHAKIGSLTLGTENQGLKKSLFDQVRLIANLDEIAKGKLIKFLVGTIGKYIAKKLQKKIFNIDTQNETKTIVKPKPPIPKSSVTKCMLCETNFGIFSTKVKNISPQFKCFRIIVVTVEEFFVILAHQTILHLQIMDLQNL